MIIQVAVGKPIPGKIELFNQFILMNLDLASQCGVPSNVKVSSYGTPGVEISTMFSFSSWEELGSKTDEMRQHQKFKEIMDFGGETEAFGEAVDSYVASLLPGFDSDSKFSEGPILATVWRPLQGKLGEMLGTFQKGREIHEKHGAKVRVFSIIGGRYAGNFAYNMSFSDNTAYGKCMSAMVEDHTRFMLEVDAEPNSEQVAQFMLDKPVIVG